MGKLWDTDIPVDKLVEEFTVGKDHVLDKELVTYDCRGSIAHATVLKKAGLLGEREAENIIQCLQDIIREPRSVQIQVNDEDCHTAIENHLAEKLGEAGKKIHICRSRNDQILTALRLYEKDKAKEILQFISQFKSSMKQVQKDYGDIVMPGYTHMQRAMPLPVSMWAHSFIEAADDDTDILNTALRLIDRSPLGTAAGFGIPVFNIDRECAAQQLGFEGLIENPLYAQFSRQKIESTLLDALTSIMLTLNKLATDLITFSMQEFNYVKIPSEFCTGSSIMPQKRNPDVLELIRGYYSVVKGESFKLKDIGTSVISGYNRDMQLTKEPLMNALQITSHCLKMCVHVLTHLAFNEEACKRACTPEIYATEDAYHLAMKMPFRDAYKEIGKKFRD